MIRYSVGKKKIIVQWNPVNTDTKGTTCHHKCPYYPGVHIKQALRENIRDTCFIDIKTKADSFTNQRLVEVYVERQSIGVVVLVWKYHVFTFLLVLGNTWIYLNSN